MTDMQARQCPIPRWLAVLSMTLVLVLLTILASAAVWTVCRTRAATDVCINLCEKKMGAEGQVDTFVPDDLSFAPATCVCSAWISTTVEVPR